MTGGFLELSLLRENKNKPIVVNLKDQPADWLMGSVCVDIPFIATTEKQGGT